VTSGTARRSPSRRGNPVPTPSTPATGRSALSTIPTATRGSSKKSPRGGQGSDAPETGIDMHGGPGERGEVPRLAGLNGPPKWRPVHAQRALRPLPSPVTEQRPATRKPRSTSGDPDRDTHQAATGAIGRSPRDGGSRPVFRALCTAGSRRPAARWTAISNCLSSASKAAAWAMTNVARQELAPHGIQVAALHVGYMDTDMTAGKDVPKVDPAGVAALALDGIEADFTEILADDVTRSVKPGLSRTTARPTAVVA